MLIIGHRGSSLEAPENTLGAFRLAWDEGADGVELDVRLSNDGAIAVLHDESFLRTAGHPGRVEDMKWSEIQGLDVGVWKDPRWRGERAPMLDDVIKTAPANGVVFVELKGGQELVDALAAWAPSVDRAEARIRFLGFSIETVSALKRRLPAFPVQWNVEVKGQDAAQGIIRAVEEAAIDGAGLGFPSGRIDVGVVAALAKRGLQTFVWTVDEAGAAIAARDAGAGCLCTNRPGYIRRVLRAG